MRKIIFVNLQKCLSCKSCEIACAVEHSQSRVLEQAIKEHPSPEKRIFVEQIADTQHPIFNIKQSIPLQCYHCEDAPCVKICPTKALEKTIPDEIVLIKPEQCIGCKWCLLVCPFGVIKLDKQGKAIIKCDYCISRLKEGHIPACVETCPTKALQFNPVEEISAEKRKKYLIEVIK